MVGGGRAQLGGQRRGAVVGQLVGVEPHTEPSILGRPENPAGLFEREGVRVDEGVRVLGQAVRGHGREDLLQEQVDVSPTLGPVLRRDGMGTEEGADDLDGMIGGRAVQCG